MTHTRERPDDLIKTSQAKGLGSSVSHINAFCITHTSRGVSVPGDQLSIMRKQKEVPDEGGRHVN